MPAVEGGKLPDAQLLGNGNNGGIHETQAEALVLLVKLKNPLVSGFG